MNFEDFGHICIVCGEENPVPRLLNRKMWESFWLFYMLESQEYANYTPHLYIPMELSHQVSMVILLDPRSLLPMDVNVEKAFEDSGKPLGCAFRLAGTGDGDA